jgi:hypothetical protein
MDRITRFITQRLKLKVNDKKSAVARPQERKFLGFSFTDGPEIRRRIAPKAVERFKERIREITRQALGVSLETTIATLAPYMRGWRGYFGFCETPDLLIPSCPDPFQAGTIRNTFPSVRVTSPNLIAPYVEVAMISFERTFAANRQHDECLQPDQLRQSVGCYDFSGLRQTNQRRRPA